MQSKKLNNGYILKIEKGEEIAETLTKFCKDNNIKSGAISGIGATNNASISYYDLGEEKYISKTFSSKNYEIISLNGNIALIDKEPFAHLHITISDQDYKVFGGHLVSAIVSVTCEIAITMSDSTVERKIDNEFGINLLEL